MARVDYTAVIAALEQQRVTAAASADDAARIIAACDQALEVFRGKVAPILEQAKQLGAVDRRATTRGTERRKPGPKPGSTTGRRRGDVHAGASVSAEARVGGSSKPAPGQGSGIPAPAPTSPVADEDLSKRQRYANAIQAALSHWSRAPHFSGDAAELRAVVAKEMKVNVAKASEAREIFVKDFSNGLHLLKERDVIERTGTVWALTKQHQPEQAEAARC